MSPTPDERLAARIADVLVQAGLILDRDRQLVQEQVGSGKASESFWQQLLRLGAEPRTGGSPQGGIGVPPMGTRMGGTGE